MKPIQKISLPNWISQEAKDIVHILNDIADGATMFVGGCVRNTVLNEIETDIDLATKHKPDDVSKILQKAGLKVIPTGIDHGTVTVVNKNVAVEVTTLRKDMATYGRHADVEFSEDWLEDAKRRDFTMNALYMDLNGNIYDPTRKGIKDAKNRHVKFVGDADARIKEDYLRILRFFRFYAQYGQGDIDKNTVKICTDNKLGLKQLSRERITQEFFKILNTNCSPDVLSIMFDADILKILQSNLYKQSYLENLICLQDAHRDAIDGFSVPLARYFILSGAQAKFHDDVLIFSKAQAAFIIKLEAITHQNLYVDEKAIKRTMIQHGRALASQGYLLLQATGQIEANALTLALIKDWEIPQCPITGEVLLKEGYQTGPELGQELERRKSEWLEEVI